MTKFLVPLGIFGLLAVVLAIGIHHSPDKGIIKSPLLGKAAPVFALPNLTDPARQVRSVDLKGRWYLFNVWGTWCGGCREEHEALLQVHRAGVVPIIGLDWKDDDAQALSWLTHPDGAVQCLPGACRGAHRPGGRSDRAAGSGAPGTLPRPHSRAALHAVSE